MAGANLDQSWTPRGARPLPIVVLASGNGSNLQAILDRFRKSRSVRVVGVASNHSDAPALGRARKAGVPVAVFPRDEFPDRKSRDAQMAGWIRGQGAQLVVSAGYLEILSSEFVDQFRDRIINLHPSLLPRFPGLNSIQRAYAEGVRRSGVTIHFVDEGVDTGPVIRQRAVWRLPGESLSRFEARIHAVEHKLLPQVIREIASGKIKIGISQSEGLVRETGKERFNRYRDWLGSLPSLAIDLFAGGRSDGHAHPSAGSR